MSRGTLAGVAAAAAWGAGEPMARRILRVPSGPGMPGPYTARPGEAGPLFYSDIRLLGAAVTSGPHWRAAGWGLHLLNGAVFGAVFVRLGGHGVVRGVAAAQVENLVLWTPGMVVVDRFHPDRRSGRWPPLLRNRRVFAYEVAMHALFGAMLGALIGRNPRLRRDFGRRTESSSKG